MTYHFAFCVNDEYANYIRVPIKSILENHKDKNYEIEIHILSDYISKRNKKKILNVVKKEKNIKISFYQVFDESLKTLKTGKWSIYTWYRILIPKHLPSEIERVLYLDADTLITDDITELFSIDLNNIAVAGSPDLQFFESKTYERLNYPIQKGYICVGVLLMNLNFWRINNLSFSIINWAKVNEKNLSCPDQDAINYICRDNKLILPLNYGIMDGFLNSNLWRSSKYKEQLHDCYDSPKIIHYNNTSPWYKEYRKHCLFETWIKYNNLLDEPVKRHYKAKGLLRLKIFIWNLLHTNVLR